jgi:hypothetical protein
VRLAKLLAATPEKGAETLIYLASSSEAANISGQFLQNCRAGSLIAEAQDDGVAQRLWRESERIAASS